MEKDFWDNMLMSQLDEEDIRELGNLLQINRVYFIFSEFLIRERNVEDLKVKKDDDGKKWLNRFKTLNRKVSKFIDCKKELSR